MKRVINIILLMLLTASMTIGISSCKDQDVVVTPNPVDQIIEMLLSETWTIVVDGQEFQFSFGDWIDTQRMTADVVEPGTDMTPDELRQYFAVTIAEDMFPGDSWFWEYCRCYIYSQARIKVDGVWYNDMGLKGAFDNFYTDDEIMGIVVLMEFQGYDVPNGPPPDEPCP